MKIVKLNAIDSTNSYLKRLARKNTLENWTVIVAKYQTQGKGQFDNIWQSEKGKNLTFSILVIFDELDIARQFYLNYAVSIAIYNVLKYYIPEKLAVKWPNDIMSANQKICGILIESTLLHNKVKNVIIGIGLNVNQETFHPSLQATSIKNRLKRNIDIDELLDKILLEIQYQLLLIKQQKFDAILKEYEELLYKKNVPAMFVDTKKNLFLGKIIGVSPNGKLRLELDDESVSEFDLKEIKFKK